LHGLLEIPILSENSKVRVYNGFARWNKIVEGTDRIRACALYYTPIKNANKIDLSRVEDITVTGTSSFGKLDLNFTLASACNGIAFYNIDTLDLLLAYVEDFTSGVKAITLYYKVEDTRFGGGLNIVTQFRLEYEIGETLDVTSGNEFSISEALYHNTTLELGYDFAVVMEEHYQISDSLSFAHNEGVSISENVYHSVVLQLGDDVAVQLENTYLIGETLNFAHNEGVSISESMTYDTTLSYTKALTEATNWVVTTDTAYDESVNRSTGDTSCRTEADTLTWLNTNYPPENYFSSHIMRVRVITTEALCAVYYY
jgi:hypothetical protein